jgi:hypothetical protein
MQNTQDSWLSGVRPCGSNYRPLKGTIIGFLHFMQNLCMALGGVFSPPECPVKVILSPFFPPCKVVDPLLKN